MSAQDRLRPVLVNRYEKVTDKLLTAAAAEHGDRLLAKVRVADVIDVDGLTGDAKRYGLSAHYDFVMVEPESSRPRFAVELDGAQHWTDPATRRRDRLKDQLSEYAGLPLLRITGDLTQRKGRWPVLTYVIDGFYLAHAFYQGQVAGHIPWDEPFIVTSVMTRTADGRLGFNALDHEARLALYEASDSGKIPFYAPDEFHTRDTETGAVHTHAWLAVAPDRYLISRVRVRDYLFDGVLPSELSSQLAVIEIADLVERWLAGEAVACDKRPLIRYMTEVQQAIDAGGFLGAGTGGALEPGGPLPMRVVTRFDAPSRGTDPSC